MALLASTFLLLVSIATFFTFTSHLFSVSSRMQLSTDSFEHSIRRRRLADGFGCHINRADVSEIPITPAWQASFPGSGSRMTWSLVQALTGIRTTDDYNSTGLGYENVVTVKTHYPVKNARGRFDRLDAQFGTRAVVVLRNPIFSIPSYFNLMYEHKNNLPNHSTRGPPNAWLKYREHDGHGFEVQLPMFEQFVSYWMEKFPDRQNMLLVAYEDLTDDEVGPAMALKIANFLGQTEGVNPVDESTIPCIWYKAVKQHCLPPCRRRLSERKRPKRPERKGPPGQHSVSSERKGGFKERPYTEQQLVAFQDVFQLLLEKYGVIDEDFARIMSLYHQRASNYQVVEKEDAGLVKRREPLEGQ